MNEKWIVDQLVEHGIQLFKAPKEELIRFTDDKRADTLINDLKNHPHAYVLACVMDRQIKAERAWIIPYRFQEKLGGDFSIETLSILSIADIRQMMTQPEPLHRFVDDMSRLFHAALQKIVNNYHREAYRIWIGEPSSAEVIYRFLEFDGIGPKIACMAANILARDFKIPFKDYYSIDISADVHVRRVFSRLGLTQPEPSVEQVIYRARALHPEFPGLMDLPSWEIGRTWCRPQTPECHACYMHERCPSAIKYT